MTYKTATPSSDSVNLGSNPSPPATRNTDKTGVSRISGSVEQPEIPEQNAHTDRTNVGTVRPFSPSNGTELISFTLYWCDDCARDAAFRDTNYDGDPALGCQIMARGTAFAHDVTHPEYPKEWIVDEKGARCTAHTTDPKCPVRCDNTIDMFERTT